MIERGRQSMEWKNPDKPALQKKTRMLNSTIKIAVDFILRLTRGNHEKVGST